MKRKLNILFLSFLTLTGLASCQKENNTEDNKNSDGGSTDGKLVPEWTEGDIIKVTCNGTSYNFKTETAGNSAKFTDDGTLTAQIIGNNAISAYYNCTSARGAFRISGEQTYKDGKSSAAIPMYAYTLNAPQNNTLALTFKPVASILRVNTTSTSDKHRIRQCKACRRRCTFRRSNCRHIHCERRRRHDCSKC